MSAVGALPFPQVCHAEQAHAGDGGGAGSCAGASGRWPRLGGPRPDDDTHRNGCPGRCGAARGHAVRGARQLARSTLRRQTGRRVSGDRRQSGNGAARPGTSSRPGDGHSARGYPPGEQRRSGRWLRPLRKGPGVHLRVSGIWHGRDARAAGHSGTHSSQTAEYPGRVDRGPGRLGLHGVRS